MAKNTVTTVTITDDIDGSSNAQTFRFSYDGSEMEIDLAKKNKTAFDKAMKPYLDASRKVRAARSRKTASVAPKRSDLSAVREWAKANGHSVSERGRIPGAITEAYEAAH